MVTDDANDARSDAGKGHGWSPPMSPPDAAHVTRPGPVGRRLLDTGAAGRVATQLLPGLADRYELRLIDHVGDGGAPVSPDLVAGELTDRDLLAEVLESVDAVVHLAGNPDPGSSWSQLREPNVEAFAALLGVARDREGRRVVFASSVHAMGAHEGGHRWPVDPAWPPAPCCAYGATKAFDEALARVYAYRSEMSLIGLRFGLCVPDPSLAQAAAGWTAPADLQQVVLRTLETDVMFAVYHAMSWASRRRWQLDTTMTEPGYEPDRSSGRPNDAGDEPADSHLSTCSRDSDDCLRGS